MATVRLYHQDPAMRQFEGNVLQCEQGESGWEVVLDQTAFYPTAGGQLHDTGHIGGRPVISVREDEAGTIYHLMDGPVSGRVLGEVDWPRRLDHAAQHTGQHLLSAAFLHVLEAETLSFHMSRESSTIDIAAESLTPEAIEQVELLANQVIRENRPILTHVVDAAEIGQFPLRKPPAVTSNIRIVEIQGFDWSACGGTHVGATGQLGLLKVKGWERHKKGVRVEWLAGGRAVADYIRLDHMTRTLCRSLTIGVMELPAHVARLQDEVASLRKQAQMLADRALTAEAQELLGEARVVRGVRVLRKVITGRTADEAKGLAQKVAAQPNAIALFGLKGALPQLIFTRSVDVRLDVGQIIREALPLIDGRGGGSPVAAQGGGSRQEGLEGALDRAMQKVVDALHAL